MSTLATSFVSVAFGSSCVRDHLKEQIHIPATMASYNPKVGSPRDIDDDDFDFEYFSRTYKPLSNLPTPPPSTRNSVSSSPVLGEEDQNVDTTLLGMFLLIFAHQRIPSHDHTPLLIKSLCIQAQRSTSSTSTHHPRLSHLPPSALSRLS